MDINEPLREALDRIAKIGPAREVVQNDAYAEVAAKLRTESVTGTPVETRVTGYREARYPGEPKSRREIRELVWPRKIGMRPELGLGFGNRKD